MALGNFTYLQLGSILEKKLEIPPYQREYAWEKGECEDLWNDLIDTIDSENNGDHFFGQIVVHTDNGKNKIIDGQQRITTSVILMACFIYAYKDLYNSLSDKNSKEANLMNRNIVTFENKIGIISYEDNYMNQNPNLTQNENDQDFFKRLLTRDESIKKKITKKSQDRMKKAFKYFADDCIKNEMKELDFESKKERIESLINTFLLSFKCMYIEASELNEAFTIFETLNARGKDLASADLLKNHLFTTGKDIETANAKWNKMLETLEDLDMTKFIRAFWNSRHEFIREKALYKRISSFVRNKKESKDLLDDLSDCSQYYHDLAKPDSPNVLTNQNLLEALNGLAILKASSFYPILLAMVSKKNNENNFFSEADMAVVAKTIEIYVFRNAAICYQTANKTEILFSSIARDIYGEELATVDEICKRIYENMASDEDFMTSFIEYETNNKDRIRYIFRKIHSYIDENNEINLNNSEIHIEHIMPEDKSQWPEITDEEHEEYLWRLGNLCLLSGPLNISISNKPFNDKKSEAYYFSKIEPNKQLCRYPLWNINSIVDRQNKLYEYAKEIWKKQ